MARDPEPGINPAPVTRAQFRAHLRQVLGSRALWPDSTLDLWITEAIRDYSAYFTRRVSVSINCTAGQRVYTLNTYTGIRGILAVEYPLGQTPPRYLIRRPETSGSFYGQPVYDLRGDPPAVLVAGESPSTGEAIGLDYSALHTVPLLDSDALTVPDHHLEALEGFVKWQAIQVLEMSEAVDPDIKNLLLSELGLNAGRAERIYRAKIRD